MIIKGEHFYHEASDGKIWIRHRKWSLFGSGTTYEEAYDNLISEAKNIKEIFEKLGNLDPKSQRMNDFLKLLFPDK